jgi:bzd-type benzoyl-CoA reductase N subunit
MDMIRQFRDVSEHPEIYARKWKQKNNGRVVGYLCSYAPEELILAAGALGYRILGGGHTISRADAHLQSYSCSLVRGALEDALSGGLDFVDGMVFPHTCDSIQRLSDIWRMNASTGFHIDAVLPVCLNTNSARDYMMDVLRRFKADLEQHLKADIHEGNLRAAVETIDGIRAGMEKLYILRRDCPEQINGSDLHAIVRSSMVMDRREFLEALNRLLADMATSISPPRRSAAKRLLLSGGACTFPDIYDIIESAGGVVVWDDLCTGFRQWSGCTHIGNDLLASIADRYLRRSLCPAKHAGLTCRGDELVRMAKENRVAGVIFLFLKFCDPHAFDYPYLKQRLDAEGIPSLRIELEDQMTAEGPLRTRCEAFMETLQAGL